MKSLIDNEKRCYVCHTTANIHRHHIYPGAFRNKSEKYGCWLYLCAYHHNMPNHGIHFDRKFDMQIRAMCQQKFNEAYPELNFREIFGRNYMEEYQMTQNEKVLNHMKQYGGITSMDAFMRYHITRLSARIWELRAAGHIIDTDSVTVIVDGKPCTFARYVLQEGETDGREKDVCEIDRDV